MARYILGRVAEDFNLIASFEPKLFEEYFGDGAHTNFSDELMRSGKGGMDYIYEVCRKLSGENDKRHRLHISMYGNNEKRLSGEFDTSSKDKFSVGVGTRGTSVRINTHVLNANGQGYIEDRRPAGDMDPYVVCALIIDATSNTISKASGLTKHYRAWQRQRGIDVEAIEKTL